MEDLIAKDKQLLVYLNNLGSETFDPFWLFITNQFYLTPIFLFVFYLLQKKVGWKNFWITLLFIAFIIMVCDQTTNIFKYSFQRLRPLNDVDINQSLRILIHRSSFSFFSGHASNSMATTVFLFFILRKYYKYTLLLFLFPLFFAYSRIYLGLHFPSDILVGYTFGFLIGYFFYTIYKKYFSKDSVRAKKMLTTTTVVVVTYFIICNVITAYLR